MAGETAHQPTAERGQLCQGVDKQHVVGHTRPHGLGWILRIATHDHARAALLRGHHPGDRPVTAQQLHAATNDHHAHQARNEIT
ncbi:MAG TPA: hypothetical protein VF910_05905 [Candidatus Bathyarchaeia archaeon]